MMNTRKSLIIYSAILITCILQTYFITSYFTSKTGQTIVQPQGFMEIQTFSVAANKIWQDGNETVVNATKTTMEIFFFDYYNVTSNIVERTAVSSKVLNITNNEVFRTYNTSYAINWAIETGPGEIDFQPGNYSLTNTIVVDKSGTWLFAFDSNFTCEQSPVMDVKGENLTDIWISGFKLWMNQTFLESS